MAASVLHLRPPERKIFDRFTKELQDGWKIAEETLSFDDAPERRRTRLSLLRVHDPQLQSFVRDAKGSSSAEALAALIANTDLSAVSEADLAELFFALGPTALSTLIEKMIQEAKTDGDLEEIASLTQIRHSLLSSLQRAS